MRCSRYVWERRPDGLRAPALVCAFKGWNDAGESATAALSFLGTALDAQRFATIDPEEFVDFQATRPTVRLREGRTRQIDWPEFEVYEARVPRAPRDLILLAGPEPVDPLAHVLPDRRRPRRGARRADGRHARRAARRRPALAPRRHHRHRLRRARSSTASASAPRATRARPGIVGVPARRLRATPGCRPRRCGPPCRTTSPSSPNPKARARAAAQARERSSA